jgi:methylglutaconyl-CoA hydratase
MNSSLVVYSLQPPAAVITLNRRERRHALNRELVAALAAAFERARQDDSRCVIVTSSGPSFCAGLDLVELEETLGQPAARERVAEDARRLASLFHTIETLPKPTIAAVNGTAVAGGAGLVSVCDLALAVPEAQFGYPGVRRGLAAAVVIPPLLRHVGERVARYLLLTGELIDAGEAQRVGLINAVVPGNQLLEQAVTLAGGLAEGGPNALVATKALLQEFSRGMIAVEAVSQADAGLWGGEEVREGLASFVARRPPPWGSGMRA